MNFLNIIILLGVFKSQGLLIRLQRGFYSDYRLMCVNGDILHILVATIGINIYTVIHKNVAVHL